MLDWQAIDTLLLDMDGTLLDLHFDNFFWLEHLPRHLASQRGQPFEATREEVNTLTESQRGHLNWYCLDYWSRTLQVDIPQLKREIMHLIRFRPHVTDFLSELKRTPHRVVLVTNAHPKSLEIKLQMTALDRYLDRVISSHDLGLPKENDGFWPRLQALEPFNPERTALIDDSLAVLRSARRFGIAHLLAIVQPDSQQPGHAPTEFAGLDSFRDIWPTAPREDA